MEKLVITPTPWFLEPVGEIVAIGPVQGSSGRTLVAKTYWSVNSSSDDKDRQQHDAKAIIAAVNATYGNHINPEAVKDLVEILSAWIEEVNGDDLKHFPLSSYKEKLVRRAEFVLRKAKL